MASTVPVLVGALLCLTGAACGGDDGGAEVPPGDPFEPAALAAELATATCAHRDACQPALAVYLDEPGAACVARLTAELTAEFAALALLADATPPRVAFQQAQFDDCLAAYGAATAACEVGVDPRACAGLFVGGAAAGEACATSDECVPSAACDRAATDACGTCRARAATGGACASTACVAGDACLEVGGVEPVCVPVTAAVGAPCGTAATGLCLGELQCVGTDTLTCQVPAALGATCDLTGVTPDCDLYALSTCGAAGTCVPLTIGAADAPCDVDAATLCDATTTCATATDTCTLLPGAGEACAFGVCAADAYCDGDTCAARLPSGAACTTSLACTGLDVCNAGTCGPRAYALTCGA